MRRPPLGLLMLCLLLVSGFLMAQESWNQPVYGGTLLLDQGENERDFQPASADSLWHRQMASLLYPRILDYDADGNLRPVVIKGWKLEDGGLKLTFLLYDPLQRGQVNRIKAGDILESLKFTLRTNPLSPAAILLRDVQGVKDYLRGESELEGFEVVDDQTFVFHLERAQPLLLHAFADINLSTSRFYDKPGFIAAGLGAFVRQGDLLQANLNFIEGRPYLDYIGFKGESRIPDKARRKVAVILDPRQLVNSRDANASYAVYPGKRCYYLVLNHNRSLMKSVARRQVIRSAVDPDALVNIFLKSIASRLTTLVPEAYIPADIQEMKLSAEKGHVNGSRLDRKLMLGYQTGDRLARMVAERVKVDLLVKSMEVQLKAVTDNNYTGCDLIVTNALISRYAPEYSLWLLLHQLYLKTRNDIWLNAPTGESFSWLAEVVREYIGESVMIPLFAEDVFIKLDPRLRGVAFRPDGTLNLENTWISPGR